MYYEWEDQPGYEQKTSELGIEQIDPGGSVIWLNRSNESAFNYD